MLFSNREFAGKITEGTTKILEKVINKLLSATYVFIQEVDRENWAVGGKLLADK